MHSVFWTLILCTIWLLTTVPAFHTSSATRWWCRIYVTTTFTGVYNISVYLYFHGTFIVRVGAQSVLFFLCQHNTSLLKI